MLPSRQVAYCLGFSAVTASLAAVSRPQPEHKSSPPAAQQALRPELIEGSGYATPGGATAATIRPTPPAAMTDAYIRSSQSSGTRSATTASAPSDGFAKPVFSFIDPRTGLIYDRYYEPQQVPAMRWEWQEVTETRWVQQQTTESRPVPTVSYVPTVTYQPQTRVENRWNPFATPTMRTEYVSQIEYQPQYGTTNQTVAFPQYVQQEVKVRVPKLVNATESRMQYVDRVRPGQKTLGQNGVDAQASVPVGPTYATVPTASTMAPTAHAPNVAPALPPQQLAWGSAGMQGATPVPSAPTNYSSGQLPSPHQSMVFPPGPAMTPIASTPIATNQASAPRPWVNWFSRSGPLFSKTIFREDRTLGGSAPTGQPAAGYASLTGGNWMSTTPAGYQTPQRQFVNVDAAATPPVPSAMAAGTIMPPVADSTRTATQRGMPVSVLR